MPSFSASKWPLQHIHGSLGRKEADRSRQVAPDLVGQGLVAQGVVEELERLGAVGHEGFPRGSPGLALGQERQKRGEKAGALHLRHRGCGLDLDLGAQARRPG